MVVQSSPSGTRPPEDKEAQSYWLKTSEVARLMGVSPPRVSELIKTNRIPEARVFRDSNGKTLRSLIPNKRCVLRPADPRHIREDAAITRWYMTDEEGAEALFRTGRIDEEEYNRRMDVIHGLDVKNMRTHEFKRTLLDLFGLEGNEGLVSHLKGVRITAELML